MKIHEIDGPALILAGPGTGKTYTLGLRLKHLIEEKEVEPETITVITFTSEAAKNMRARISDPQKEEIYIPYNKQPKNIMTMHSLGFKIIRENPEKAGLNGIVRLIPGDYEREILIGDAAQILGHERSNGEIVSKCRQFGNCTPLDSPECNICNVYKQILKKCNSVDYNEQILLAIEILESNAEILKEYQNKAKHLLVDEYQDINNAQYRLIKLLSEGNEQGLFVVGDDDQSIYSWRGGSPKFIRNFSREFGDEAEVQYLNKSYRCHRNILEGSLSIVKKYDEKRCKKEKFEYEVEEGKKINIHSVPSDNKEAKTVRQIVQEALPSQDVLILVPQRKFSEEIVKELRNHQINYSTKVSEVGTGLPMISRLNDWLENPNDSISLRRCIESFIDRLGSKIPSNRVRKKEKKDERSEAFLLISRLWKDVIEGKAISLWTSLIKNKENNPLLNSIHDAFRMLLYQYCEKSDITEFISNLSEKLSPWRNTKSFLNEIISWVETIRKYSYENSDTSVRIMTLQGAKGLEASVVCILGIEESVIPRNEKELPEQSRLLYVSMTRAINELHLFHARLRSSSVLLKNVFAKGKPDVVISRFINDIPHEYIEKIYHKF